jgi:hypothetical protein
MGKIAEGHHLPVAIKVVDRRLDFTKLPFSARRSPARVVALHHEALSGDEQLIDDCEPGTSGLSAAVKTVRIVWERHGQAPSVISDRQWFWRDISTIGIR